MYLSGGYYQRINKFVDNNKDLRLTLSINILTQNVSCAFDRCSQLSHFHPHPLLWNMLVNMS